MARTKQGAGVAALAGVLLWLPQSSPTSACCSGSVGCNAMAGSATALFEREVFVSGADAFQHRLAAPPGQALLVLAMEQHIDVVLSVAHDGAVQRADSPLQGFGVQRLLLPAGERDWQVEIFAKDHDSPPGEVHIRVVPVPATDTTRGCARVQRALAAGDAAQARGWAISNGLQSAAGGEAEAAHRASIDAYREALASRWIPESLRAALILSVATGYYRGLADWRAAQSWAARAGRHYRSLRDEYGDAQSQLLRGMALIEVDPGEVRNSLSRAEELLRHAAQTHGARGERREQAHAMNNLGIALYLAGMYPEAREAYESAAGHFAELGEQARAWQVADNLGLIDYELGRLEKAAQTYDTLLAHPGLRARPALYLNVLTNGALVQLERGEAGEALRAYQDALVMARDIQDAFYEALSLQGIGGAYEALGDPEMALTHYQGALRLRTREASARYRLETLRSLGDVERRIGRAGRALALDQEAMGLADTDLDHARMRLRLAADHDALGDTRRSLAELAPLFDHRVQGDGFIHAHALLLRGRMFAASAQWQNAGRDLGAALQAFERFDSASGQFDARVMTAALERDRGNSEAAIREVDAAIALAERLRLQSANPGLRASLLESLRPAHDLKITLLADASADAATAQARQELAWQALAVAESARARAMQDYAAMASDVAGASPLLARRALYVELSQAQARLDDASLNLATDDRLLQTIRENLAGLRRQIDQLEAQLAAPGVSDSAHSLPVLQAVALPPHIAVVQYWLGATRTFAWVATAGELQMIDLGASAPIGEAAATAQAALRDGQSGDVAVRLDAMDALSALIWHPLAGLVPARATVVFVPDMTLHYIPFAALTDGAPGHFLVESRDVATAASLRQLLEPAVMPQLSAQRMLIVADPHYGSTAARLPATAREADTIARIAGALRVDRLQGREATRARFLGASLGEYQYIHIATHALANARIPQLSALRLASDAGAQDGDGRVFAADLLAVKLNAQLVVLSACDTALGRVVSGEGVIGLRYVLLARGAQAVVSSLWKVGDRHAEEFMTDFYAALLGERSSTAAAMSAAMRSVMARHGADPAVWAGFELSVRSLPAGISGPDV